MFYACAKFSDTYAEIILKAAANIAEARRTSSRLLQCKSRQNGSIKITIVTIHGRDATVSHLYCLFDLMQSLQ